MTDEDPEVIADLQLRASSERDSTRTRGLGVYDWQRPELVGEWRCRRCGAGVGVTQDAVDRLDDCNRILANMGDPAPLSTSNVVLCAPCIAIITEAFAVRAMRVRTSTRDIIQQLKAGAVANIEVRRATGVFRVSKAEALQQLDQWGHPDVKGLASWLEQQDVKSSGRRSRKVGM